MSEPTRSRQAETDRNLLFGVLALQADFIDNQQFAEGCAAWAARKSTPLADLMVERGWLTATDREHDREGSDDGDRHRDERDNCCAQFAEKQKGQIAPGQLADFIVLDRDITGLMPAKLLETKVLRTVVGGKTVFATLRSTSRVSVAPQIDTRRILAFSTMLRAFSGSAAAWM